MIRQENNDTTFKNYIPEIAVFFFGFSRVNNVSATLKYAITFEISGSFSGPEKTYCTDYMYSGPNYGPDKVLILHQVNLLVQITDQKKLDIRSNYFAGPNYGPDKT